MYKFKVSLHVRLILTLFFYFMPFRIEWQHDYILLHTAVVSVVALKCLLITFACSLGHFRIYSRREIQFKRPSTLKYRICLWRMGWVREFVMRICLCPIPRTTDSQWRHKLKISEKLGRCGRQNMLPPFLKIWDWDWIFGRAVKAISPLGVRSPWYVQSLKEFRN